MLGESQSQIRTLLNFKMINLTQGSTEHAAMDPKWIVIEGLDGVGKSTVVQHLQALLPSSVKSPNPPTDIRKYFDAFGQGTIRRSYYFLHNAIVKDFAVQKMNEGVNVITDRYLASTLAYRTIDSGDGFLTQNVIMTWRMHLLSSIEMDLRLILLFC